MNCLKCGADIGSSLGLCESCKTHRRHHNPDLEDRPQAKHVFASSSWVLYTLVFTLILLWLFFKYQQRAEDLRRLMRPDVLAPNEPVQDSVARRSWQIADYKITALASFYIEAQVLLRETFSYGREADISPLDLTLAWGPLSSALNRQGISFSHFGRYYTWSTSEALPIPENILNSHVANMHMIPANEKLKSQLLSIKIGQVVRLKGYLVDVKASDGWSWTSSLSRDDSGAGACELIWVEEVAVK